MAAANAALQRTQEITSAHIDIDMYKRTLSTTSMDVDTADVNMGNFAGPLPKVCGSICANRTKPLNSNKHQKRLGAKKAKKMEVEIRMKLANEHPQNQKYWKTSLPP